MQTVNILAAKTHLSRIFEQVWLQSG